MRILRPAPAFLVGLLACLGADTAAGSPPFPGARRVSDASGRWYVAVESRSDRWAFVERPAGAPPVPRLYDPGNYRHGLPGPDPVGSCDRVLARGRLRGYPEGILVAGDGSGFAAVTSGYGPERRILEFVHWVPVKGPRVVLAALEPVRAPGGWPRYGPSWRLRLFSQDLERLALRGLDGSVRVLRLADGRMWRTDGEDTSAALFVESTDDEPARLDVALLQGPEGTTAAKQTLGAAVRGDAGLGLTPRERARVIPRAFELLGAEAGPLLLPALVDADGNVRRAAHWSLVARPDVGLPVARAALADREQPSEIRRACAWLLTELLPPGRTQPLLASIGDPDASVSTAAVEALADRRWDAGPEFLALLKQSGPEDEQVARFFVNHVIPGAAPLLVAALRRTRPGTPLRKRTVEALETQTLLHGIGEDPDAWAHAIQTLSKR